MNIITLGIPGGIPPIITSGLLGAAVPPTPVPPVVVTQAHGGAVGSSSFAEWLASRPIMGRAFRRPVQEVVLPTIEEVSLLNNALQENQRRAALLAVLLMLEEDGDL